MKGLKMLLAVALLASFVNICRADEGNKVRFIGGVGIGGAIKGDGFGSAYNSGAGIDGNLGFAINHNLSILLAIDSMVFTTSVSGIYSGEVNFAPSVKYAFGDSKSQFYLIGGLGVNDNILFLTSGSVSTQVSQSNFMIEPGAGFQFPLNDGLDMYIQAKFVDVFAASTFSYVPITLGLDFL